MGDNMTPTPQEAARRVMELRDRYAARFNDPSWPMTVEAANIRADVFELAVKLADEVLAEPDKRPLVWRHLDDMDDKHGIPPGIYQVKIVTGHSEGKTCGPIEDILRLNEDNNDIEVWIAVDADTLEPAPVRLEEVVEG